MPAAQSRTIPSPSASAGAAVRCRRRRTPGCSRRRRSGRAVRSRPSRRRRPPPPDVRPGRGGRRRRRRTPAAALARARRRCSFDDHRARLAVPDGQPQRLGADPGEEAGHQGEADRAGEAEDRVRRRLGWPGRPGRPALARPALRPAVPGPRRRFAPVCRPSATSSIGSQKSSSSSASVSAWPSGDASQRAGCGRRARGARLRQHGERGARGGLDRRRFGSVPGALSQGEPSAGEAPRNGAAGAGSYCRAASAGDRGAGAGPVSGPAGPAVVGSVAAGSAVGAGPAAACSAVAAGSVASGAARTAGAGAAGRVAASGGTDSTVGTCSGAAGRGAVSGSAVPGIPVDAAPASGGGVSAGCCPPELPVTTPLRQRVPRSEVRVTPRVCAGSVGNLAAVAGRGG